MAQVKHVIKNGIVNLKQAVSGRKTGINVSLYEYVDEEDKPRDEYIFENDGASSLSFSADGHESETCKIRSLYGHDSSYTDTLFSCTDKPSWVNVETVQTGNTQITVTVDANSNYSERSGQITLTQSGSGYTLEIQVRQAAAESVGPGPSQDEYVFEAQDITFTFTAEDGSDSLSSGLSTDSTTVTSTKNGGWIDFTIDGGTGLGSGKQFMNWLVVTSEHTGGTTATLHIGVKKNDTDKFRSQSFTLTQDESGNTINITVNQAAGTVEPKPNQYVFEVDKQYINGGSGEYADTVNVTSTKNGEHLDWSIVNQPQAWVHLETQGDVINIEFSDNHAESEDTQPRNASVRLKQSETNNEILLSFHQEGEEFEGTDPSESTYVFTISEDNISLLPAENVKNVDVISTKNGNFIGWTVQGGNPLLDSTGKMFNDWLTVNPANDTANMEQNLTLIAGVNETGETRTASFDLHQDESGKTLTVNVSQTSRHKPEITYEYHFRFNQGESNTQSIEWNDTADHTLKIDSYRRASNSLEEFEKVNFSVESKPDWLEASVDMSDSRNTIGTLKFKATGQNDGEVRAGDIKLKQEGSDNVLTVTVTQRQKPAGPDLSDLQFTGSEMVSYKGGTATLTISGSQGESWTISAPGASNHWHLAESNGAGDKTINVTVDANTDNADKACEFTLRCGSNNAVTKSVTLRQRHAYSEMRWDTGGSIWNVNLDYQGNNVKEEGLTNKLYSRYGNESDGWESSDVTSKSYEGVVTGLPSLGISAACEVRCEIPSGNGADGYIVTLSPHITGLDQWDGRTDGSENVNYTITISNKNSGTATIGGIISPAGGKD